jgi:hypothetical protein
LRELSTTQRLPVVGSVLHDSSVNHAYVPGRRITTTMEILARCLKAQRIISVPFAVFAFSIQGSRSTATQAYNNPLLGNADIKETAFVNGRHLTCGGLVTGGVTGCTLN